MTKIKKYIPHLIILLIIFFAGRYSKSDKTPELEQKWKSERKLILDQLQKKQVEIATREARQQARERKWYSDSLGMVNVIQAKERANKQLRKENEKINLTGTDNADLDSVDLILFGPR